MDEPSGGDAALLIVSMIGSQLRAQGLLNVDLMEEAARTMLARDDVSDTLKATVRRAMPTIAGMKPKTPHH